MDDRTTYFSPQTEIGGYRVVNYCASGGMGDVYKVEIPLLKEVFAMKVMRDIAQDNERAQHSDRFLDEANTMVRLRHDKIVTLHTVGIEPAQHTPYLVMDYVGVTPAQRANILNGTDWFKLPSNEPHLHLKRESLSLEEVLQHSGALSERVAFILLWDIASALQYAHNFGDGVFHCDLKPGNILLREDGHAVVADFGLAQMRSASETESDKTICGTPDYMAPEQYDPSRPITAAVDIYAFGVMCYRVLTGRFPIGAWTRPSALGLNPAWDTLIEKCLETEPEKRWHSMGEVLRLMRSLASDKSAHPHKKISASRFTLIAVTLSFLAMGIATLAIVQKGRKMYREMQLTQATHEKAFVDRDLKRAQPDPYHYGTLIYPENAPTALPISKYTLPHVSRLGLPKQVTEIPDEFWGAFPRLEYIACDPENPTYVAFDGILYRRDDMTRPYYIPPRIYGKIKLPDSVTDVAYPWQKSEVTVSETHLLSVKNGAYDLPLELFSDHPITWRSYWEKKPTEK